MNLKFHFKFDLWYQAFISTPQGEGAFIALADHIRRYLYDKQLALDYGIPLPKAKNQLHGQNEVIAKFVNVKLQTNAKYSRQLERQRTVLVSWNP